MKTHYDNTAQHRVREILLLLLPVEDIVYRLPHDVLNVVQIIIKPFHITGRIGI